MRKQKHWLEDAPDEVEYFLDCAVGDQLFPNRESITKEFALELALDVLDNAKDDGHAIYDELHSCDSRVRKHAQQNIADVKKYVKRACFKNCKLDGEYFFICGTWDGECLNG